MINLWIGLCRGVKGLPESIRTNGYVDKFIEPNIGIRPVPPNTKHEKVNPELIIASSKIGHTILFEWKSGKNTEEDQLRRYSLIKQQDLIQWGLDTAEATMYNVVYVALEQNIQRIKIGLDKGSYTFVLAKVNDDGITTESGRTFNNALIDEAFSVLGKVSWDFVPNEFVPIDSYSPGSEVAEKVIPCIVEAMLKRKPQLAYEDVASQICDLTWGIMNKKARDEITSRVKQILETAAKQHFKEYIKTLSTGRGVEIIHNPISMREDRRSHSFRRLRKIGEQLISYLRTQDVQPELSFPAATLAVDVTPATGTVPSTSPEQTQLPSDAGNLEKLVPSVPGREAAAVADTAMANGTAQSTPRAQTPPSDTLGADATPATGTAPSDSPEQTQLPSDAGDPESLEPSVPGREAAAVADTTLANDAAPSTPRAQT